MSNDKNVLICKRVYFYSSKDEEAFFEWIKKIDCIKETWALRDELYLKVGSSRLSDKSLRDLLALFYRYKIDMKQLSRFLNERNREWFRDGVGPKGYWHRRVFGAK